jgi:hypothetical protein
MNSTQTLPVDPPQVKGRASHNRARLFYSGAAAALFILAFLGFQQFYLHGKAYPDRELAPPIRTLLIVHGVAMSAWMLLFVAQPLLIVAATAAFTSYSGVSVRCSRLASFCWGSRWRLNQCVSPRQTRRSGNWCPNSSWPCPSSPF